MVKKSETEREKELRYQQALEDAHLSKHMVAGRLMERHLQSDRMAGVSSSVEM